MANPKMSRSELDPGWICPDCTVDLTNVVHHPKGWRFCPFSGRPSGMLHITPTKLQRDWDGLLANTRRYLGDRGEAFLCGLLAQYASRIDAESYISGEEGPLLFQWERREDRHAHNIGMCVASFLERAVEWRTHMIGLMSGKRGLQGTNERRALPRPK